MKRRLSICAAVSLAWMLGQFAWVHVQDDFVYTEAGYKDFIHGFPLQVHNCPAHQPMFTPKWQIPLRLGVNFVLLAGVGLGVWEVIRRGSSAGFEQAQKARG